MKFESKNNPYTLQFSYIPIQLIARKSLTEEIINDYSKNIPTFRGHFLTGIRGCGKTVLMAEISKKMSENNEWIVIDIENPEADIIDSIVRGLYRIPEMKRLFVEAKLDISVLGIGLSIEKSNAVASNQSDALRLMLEVLQKAKKRVLVTIDEVTYCKEISAFSHTLSAYARAGFEIFTLMTGLKENIKEIKNDKSLTFLYRAKEHTLEPLNITAIIGDYERVFGLNRETAEEMAFITKGYSFAFQALGYLCWEYLSRSNEETVDVKSLLSELDQYLAEFVYDKVWSELTALEKKVVVAIAKTDTGEVKTIREIINMNSSKFSVYRERLMDKGLIDGREYGKIRFFLPRFAEYSILQNALY